MPLPYFTLSIFEMYFDSLNLLRSLSLKTEIGIFFRCDTLGVCENEPSLSPWYSVKYSTTDL